MNIQAETLPLVVRSYGVEGTPIIALNGVTKRFGRDSVAVDNLSLTVEPGRFLSLLGPSGCGKSTTLRLLAGLETPDTGSIHLAGACVADERRWVSPEDRRVGMVFQDYALFPHLTVGENIAFALRREDTARRRRRIHELTELVGMGGLARRYPHQLSGGQQQRVALARALAANPAVVLLDEPFSNLDAALRESTRAEVAAILRRAGTTTILVTHDQEEAFSLADTVAVMFDGAVVQCAAPREIYLNPASRRVATFVGGASFLDGEAAGDTVHCVLGALPLAASAYGPVTVLIRPDSLTVRFTEDGAARIESRRFFGPYQSIVLRLPDGSTVEARLSPHTAVTDGAPCAVGVTGPVVSYPR